MFTNRLSKSVVALCALVFAMAAARPYVFQEEQEEPMGEQPTEHHKMLLKSVGDWTGTMSMDIPGMGLTEFKATEKVRAIGELWTQADFSCDMGMEKPFVGTGCNGYDIAKNKFVGTWVDCFTTSIVFMEGDYDKEKNLLIMKYTAKNEEGKMTPRRIETRSEENSYTSTFFENDTKTMVINMKRKSAAKGMK